jgi:hypothetical protein
MLMLIYSERKHCFMAEKVMLILVDKLKRTEPPHARFEKCLVAKILFSH